MAGSLLFGTVVILTSRDCRESLVEDLSMKANICRAVFLFVAAFVALPALVQAGGGVRVGIGVGIGPGFYRPYPYPYYPAIPVRILSVLRCRRQCMWFQGRLTCKARRPMCKALLRTCRRFRHNRNKRMCLARRLRTIRRLWRPRRWCLPIRRRTICRRLHSRPIQHSNRIRTHRRRIPCRVISVADWKLCIAVATPFLGFRGMLLVHASWSL